MFQFGRVHGDDWSYAPVKARKNKTQKQKQQIKQQVESKTKALAESDKHSCRSNLDMFLESTTPLIPAHYFSKTTMRGWKTCNIEFQPYFTLGDLWESFTEWSAYGTGVPLVLEGSDAVVQYYVPYLSGIQLYGDVSTPTPRSNVNSRRVCEDSDGDSCRDSSSYRSSDNEFDSRDHLRFEYLEHDPPYCRVPLTDKVLNLARFYPGLKTLRSCDLLPISWMSVAWYPIYRIPNGSTLKDLDACFLTYHFLSTPMGDDQLPGSGNTQAPVVIYPSEIDGVPKISLPVFGMASYKFKGSMWTHNGTSERLQMTNSLTQAADNWLRLQRVNHPDFQFFASHGTYQK